jgi:hypothetical protein
MLRGKISWGVPLFRFFCIFINKCLESCLRGVLYLPSPHLTPPVRIYGQVGRSTELISTIEIEAIFWQEGKFPRGKKLPLSHPDTHPKFFVGLFTTSLGKDPPPAPPQAHSCHTKMLKVFLTKLFSTYFLIIFSDFDELIFDEVNDLPLQPQAERGH